MLDGVALTPKVSICSLGVLLDLGLLLNVQVVASARCGYYYQLRLVMEAVPTRDQKAPSFQHCFYIDLCVFKEININSLV